MEHGIIKMQLDITILAKIKHISFQEVAHKILAVDDKLCTEKLLESLLENAPTPEEKGKLKVFVTGAAEEDVELLSKPDAFCVQVMDIERYKERLENMLFRSSFWEKHQHLSRVSFIWPASIHRLTSDLEYVFGARSVHCCQG